MLTSPDFKELLNLFTKYNVKYLIVGGYAVMRYSEPRFTKDLDLFISIELQNATAVYHALKEFGAPLSNLTVTDFTQERGNFKTPQNRHTGGSRCYGKGESTGLRREISRTIPAFAGMMLTGFCNWLTVQKDSYLNGSEASAWEYCCHEHDLVLTCSMCRIP
jgi:hypothetical protein